MSEAALEKRDAGTAAETEGVGGENEQKSKAMQQGEFSWHHI